MLARPKSPKVTHLTCKAAHVQTVWSKVKYYLPVQWDSSRGHVCTDTQKAHSLFLFKSEVWATKGQQVFNPCKWCPGPLSWTSLCGLTGEQSPFPPTATLEKNAFQTSNRLKVRELLTARNGGSCRLPCDSCRVPQLKVIVLALSSESCRGFYCSLSCQYLQQQTEIRDKTKALCQCCSDTLISALILSSVS